MNKQALSKKQQEWSNELAPQIEAIIILDTNGNRLCAKYYSTSNEFVDKDAQTKFEQTILAKANRSAPRTDSLVIDFINYPCT